ncbi:MAG: hypothetical protein IPM54_05435 [Polyangiaceae bacterium]|nr:hypothetical protein [Polyangiaceae bacterium]
MASCVVDDESRPRSNVIGAGGGTIRSGSGVNNPIGPCADGTKIECHITVGKENDVLTCLHGERTCVAGTWGPCVGEFSSKSLPHSDEASSWVPGEYRALGLSDAGPCQNNPCDPYCQDFEETPPVDAGYEVVPEITTVWHAGSFYELLDGLPGGFVNKGIKTPCTKQADCQFDSHCLPTGSHGITCEDGAANCCMPWKPGEYDKTCALPDVSAGLACAKPDGTKIIPVCNRGYADLVPPVTIYVFPGNSTQFPKCEPDKDPSICHIPNGAPPIKPGECVEVSSCAAYLPGNGVRTIMVNGPFMAVGNLPDNPDYKPECSCDNNWTVWKGTAKSPCQPMQVYQANPIVKNLVYEANCPSGSRVQWGYLTWDTTTPLDSSVLWEARTATTNAGLGAASYVELGTAKATPLPNTQICSMAGPAECPINLYTTFGSSAARNAFLELQITMNPTTDETQGSKVNHWQITYSCPPAE